MRIVLKRQIKAEGKQVTFQSALFLCEADY